MEATAVPERFEVFGRVWPACSIEERRVRCLSTRRFAGKHGRSRNIGLYCEYGHRHDWAPDLPWMGHDAFVGEDAEFAGVFPPGYISEKARVREDARFRMSEGRRKQFQFERDDPDVECSICKAPQMLTPGDRRSLYQWLEHHRKETFDELLDQLENLVPRPKFSNFMLRIDTTLQAKIRYEVEDSILEPDHGVPRIQVRSIEARLKTKLHKDLMRFAMDGLVFPTCKKCNRGRNGAPDTEDQLRRRYINSFFGGNADVAVADQNWALFEVLMKLAYHPHLDQQYLASR